MKRITSLNEDKDCQISDLEALLIVCEKLLNDKLEQKPKAGITLAKGKSNERKISYKEAKILLKLLGAYFGYKGCISIGVCQTCDYFEDAGRRGIGMCKKNGSICHIWDTCKQHSKEGGGYGV